MADHIDTSSIVQELERDFRNSKNPVTVSFRSLVPWLPYNAQRFTHQIHSYPAKVIPQIPNFFLNCRRLIEPGAVVLDPFCGSGTIPLEACLSGHDCIVSDSNPLARLITVVKTTPLSPTSLNKNISDLRQKISARRHAEPPDVVNITYWYLPQVIKQLSRVASSIRELPRGSFERLCWVALSICARKASLADPRVSVPVKLKPSRYPKTHWLREKSVEQLRKLENLDAVELFFRVLTDSAAAVASLWRERCELGRVTHVYEDSLATAPKSLVNHKPASVDVIITSPPYLGAQKYVRATSLSLGWLSFSPSAELRAVEDRCIGREHFRKHHVDSFLQSEIPKADEILREVRVQNPLRAHIAARYLVEMREVLQTCTRLLRPGGICVLVSGSNELCGHVFNTTGFLRHLCLTEKLKVRLELTDSIHSRGLMTRRNKTAGIIPFESVTLFQKQ